MAITFIDATSNSSDSTTSLLVGPPLTIQNGDILVAYGFNYSTGDDAITPPSGFAEWLFFNMGGSDRRNYIWWKRCSSESGNYTFTSGGGAMAIHIIALRGCLATGDPLDVSSNTGYSTSNVNVQAAEMTTTVTGAQVWAGFSYQATNHTLTVPAAFTLAESTLILNATDPFRNTSGYRIDAGGATWGATSVQNGTCSGATTTKHAMMVSIKAASESATSDRSSLVQFGIC